MPNIFEEYSIEQAHDNLPASIPVSDMEAWTSYSNWESDDKALVLSDAHIPYHSQTALAAAVDYGRKREVNTVIVNGDWLDCAAISYWNKDPRLRSFASEVKLGIQSFKWLRKVFPNAKIVYKIGNHEERWERFVEDHPKLVGLECLDPKNLLDLRGLDIELVRDGRIIKLGQLNVLHGHELGKGGASTVNPARGLFLKTGEYSLIGHHHRSSHHSEPTLQGRNVSTWSTGCLCDLRPKYARVNKWNHGASIVTIRDEEGHFAVENFFISDSGRVY